MEFHKIVEVGAGDYFSLYCKELIDTSAEFYIFEPNRLFHKDLVGKLWDKTNVNLFNLAVGNEYKKVNFFNYGYASWVEGMPSFVFNATDFEDKRADFQQYYQQLITKVDMVPLSFIDRGGIDYLSINCNGSELLVLEGLISRPKIIRTCYYCHNHLHWSFTNKVRQKLIGMGYLENIINKSRLDTFFEVEYHKR